MIFAYAEDIIKKLSVPFSEHIIFTKSRDHDKNSSHTTRVSVKEEWILLLQKKTFSQSSVLKHELIQKIFPKIRPFLCCHCSSLRWSSGYYTLPQSTQESMTECRIVRSSNDSLSSKDYFFTLIISTNKNTLSTLQQLMQQSSPHKKNNLEWREMYVIA